MEKEFGKNRDETFHITITKSYDYGWRFNKILFNNGIIRDFENFIVLFYPQPIEYNWDRKTDSIMMLKLDNLMTCVQFAEDLAAVSLSIIEKMNIQLKMVNRICRLCQHLS